MRDDATAGATQASWHSLKRAGNVMVSGVRSAPSWLQVGYHREMHKKQLAGAAAALCCAILCALWLVEPPPEDGLPIPAAPAFQRAAEPAAVEWEALRQMLAGEGDVAGAQVDPNSVGPSACMRPLCESFAREL